MMKPEKLNLEPIKQRYKSSPIVLMRVAHIEALNEWYEFEAEDAVYNKLYALVKAGKLSEKDAGIELGEGPWA